MGSCLSQQAAPGGSHNTEVKQHKPQDPPMTPSAGTAKEVPLPCHDLTLIDEDGNERVPADPDRKTMEEEEYDSPSTLQEQLNEMLEAIYALISEEQIQEYQQYLQDIEKQKIAENSAKALSPAIDFELTDQDDQPVKLEKLCKEGPVVIQFYRGKWCPHCNAGLMKFKEYLPAIKEQGANLIAISPMLPDGTQFLASKRDLDFAVLSDVGNKVAREYKVTFVVPESIRPTFQAWGNDAAKANGDDLWEVPLAATYVINQKMEIVWTFVDNNHGCWAEPSDVVHALKELCGEAKLSSGEIVNANSKTRGKGSVDAKKPKKTMFGRKKQPAGDYIGGIMGVMSE